MIEPQQCTCTGTNAGLNTCTNCPTPWPDIPGATRIRQYPDERREQAETDMLSVLPEPEDACRLVDVDGETIRVRGVGEFTEQDREFAAEIVRAAKRKFAAEPVAVQLRQEIAGALRDVPGRWSIRAQTDAVMAVVERHLEFGPEDAWCKTCRRVWNGRDHRCETDAEQRLARARGLHRESCPLATGAVKPAAFTCSMCEALDEPARTTPNNPATSTDNGEQP